MQDNLQIADSVETTTAAAPFELTLEQLQQVGGGLGPNDNWATTTAAGPNDNW